MVASVRAAMQRLSPSPPDPVVIKKGDEVSLQDLYQRLSDMGYERTDRVEARGEFAVRGGILDLFPAQAADAVRIDLFGDTVEDLRRFSVSSQRSTDPVEEVVAYPAREFRPDPDVRERARELLRKEPWAAATWDRMAEGQIFSGMESWLPWLAEPRSLLDEVSSETRVVLVDPSRSRDRARELIKEEEEMAAALASTWGSGAPAAGDHPALHLELELDRVLEMPPIPISPDDSVLETTGFDATPGDPVIGRQGHQPPAATGNRGRGRDGRRPGRRSCSPGPRRRGGIAEGDPSGGSSRLRRSRTQVGGRWASRKSPADVGPTGAPAGGGATSESTTPTSPPATTSSTTGMGSVDSRAWCPRPWPESSATT